MTSEAFIAGRARLHEARRAERVLAFDLMVEFIKAMQGDVSSEQVGALFHKWKMPYPATAYLAAREKAGVALQKSFSRDSGSRAHVKKLEETFRMLIETTPVERRPKAVEPLDTHVINAEAARVNAPQFLPPPVPQGIVPTPAITDAVIRVALRQANTSDLLSELQRRKEEAREILELLERQPGYRGEKDKPQTGG